MPESKFAAAIRLPSAKFPEIGASVSGVVVEVTEAEVPHFNAKGQIEGIERDEDGTPVMQLDVTIQQAGAGKIVLHTGGSIFYAIGRALAEVGAEDVDAGDTLTVTYTGDGPKKAGRNAPKQYSAEIVKA